MNKIPKKIGAISTFLDQLKKLTDSDARLIYFRGHSKLTYKLEPSIYRNPGWIANESTMLKDLILRCPNDFPSGLSTFQCLVKMQHYGLPTRLLDVTSNPLVALYFACETSEKNDEDGEVILFGYDINQVKYFDSDTATVIANLSRQPANLKIPITGNLEEFNQTDEIKFLLHDIRQEKPHFESKIIKSDLSRVVCVKPILENPRIIRQEGAFLLFGCSQDKNNPAQLEEKSIIGRIIINQEKKRELSNHLQTLGISKATLFPEIDHVARHIKDYYFTPTINHNNLTKLQKSIFLLLRTTGPKSVHDIAELTMTTAVSANHQIAKLYELGAVEAVGTGHQLRWRIKENIRVLEST